MNKMTLKLVNILFVAFGLFYVPIYIAAFMLHRVALLLLSIAYLFGLRLQLAKDCFKQVFKYGKDDERQPRAPRVYW